MAVFGPHPNRGGILRQAVAALRWGGFLDTVVAGICGVFFDGAKPGSIAAAVRELVGRDRDADAIELHAHTSSEAQFIAPLQSLPAA